MRSIVALLLVASCVGCGVDTPGGGSGEKPKPEPTTLPPALSPSPAKAKGVEYKSSVEGDGWKATLLWAHHDSVGGYQSGEWRILRPLIIRLLVENTTQTKLVRWQGWQEQQGVEVSDEHGNRYKWAYIPRRGWEFAKDHDREIDPKDAEKGNAILVWGGVNLASGEEVPDLSVC